MTNNNMKVTYISAIDHAIEAMTAQNVEQDFIEKMRLLRSSVEKRNTKPSTPTPKEQAKINADELMMEQIKEVLSSATEPMTVTQIKQASEAFVETKVQKLSAIVRKMLIDGIVVRTEVKHKAVFALA